jgi:hypothetical protein
MTGTITAYRKMSYDGKVNLNSKDEIIRMEQLLTVKTANVTVIMMNVFELLYFNSHGLL